MAISLGFGSALSGLNVSSKSLDVTGNNIANSNTIGFKSSRAEFSDVLARTVASGLATQKIGMGANTQAVVQQFKQGGMQSTENPLDAAINGRGFFLLKTSDGTTYTRNGQFHLDAVPGTPVTETSPMALFNNMGQSVLGYPADYSSDPQGVIDRGGEPAQLNIEKYIPGVVTSKVQFAANLAAGSAPLAGTPFNPQQSSSYHHADGFSVVDANGEQIQVGLNFRKLDADQWEAYIVEGGVAQPTPLSIGFDARGNLVSGQTQTLTLASGQTVELDLTGTTEYGSAFSVEKKSQDGYLEGSLSGVSFDKEGVLVGSFTNGETRKLGQLALANFDNLNGLMSLGDNQWVATSAAGDRWLGAAGDSTGFGVINGATLEDASVDLNQELVNLIIQQRNYQANAQAIKTQDQILQTLSGIR